MPIVITPFTPPAIVVAVREYDAALAAMRHACIRGTDAEYDAAVDRWDNAASEMEHLGLPAYN